MFYVGRGAGEGPLCALGGTQQEPETETGGVRRLTRERGPGPTCGVRDKVQTELRGRAPAAKRGRGFREGVGARRAWGMQAVEAAEHIVCVSLCVCVPLCVCVSSRVSL